VKKPILAVLGALALVSPLSAQLISQGRTLTWSTNTGQTGSLRIANVSGPYFEAEQTNEKNRSAGVIRLYGAVLDNGRKVVLINASPWKEVWEGSLSDHEITGNLVVGTARFTFRITEPVAAGPRNPFVEGKTMKWSTGAGQSGIMRVVASSGSTFTVEQKNDRNPAAGLTRFECEFRDGKVILVNKQWHETWEGTWANGKVTGKINGRTEFTISE